MPRYPVNIPPKHIAPKRALQRSQKLTTDSQTKRICPLKSSDSSSLTDTIEQLNRWDEHYSEFYTSSNYITVEVADSVSSLLETPELDEPTFMEELLQTLDKTVSAKALSLDGIPLISSNVIRLSYPICSTSFKDVGQKVLSLRKWVTQRSLFFTKTMTIKATVATTGVSPFLA